MDKIIKTSIWLTLSELAFNISGYIIHSVLGRFLGPAEYGRFSLIITFSTMIIVLIGRGIPISMSKFLSEIPQEKSNEILFIKQQAIRLQLIVISAITILYFLAAPFFAKLLRDESLTDLFRFSSLIIPSFAIAAFYISYFNGIHHFNQQAFLKFVRAGARVSFILGLGYLYKTGGAIIGQALAPLSVLAVALFIDPYKKVKTGFKKTKEEITQINKKILNFAWPITLFLVFYELMITIDLYLVKAILRDDHLTGLYNSALTVGRIPYYVFYFLSILLLPKISNTVAQKMEEQTKRIMTVSFRFMLMLLIPSVFLLSYFAPSAIRFFYGAAYTEAAAAMSVLSFGFGFLTVFYIITFVLNGAGKNKIPMYLSIFGAILNTFLNFFFISRWGIIGSAIATSITAFIILVPAVIYTSRNICSFLQTNSIIKYFLASGLVYLIAIRFFPQGHFVFFVWGAILMMIYFAILSILLEIKKADWHKFYNLIFKKNKS
ncbi:MAG: oligosaccharide flippase family protein [Candidatus Moranbacteria bacterium]|nr:oligosaccharide flippase family protein [Candidatus Moranbacteria bacterium]